MAGPRATWRRARVWIQHRRWRIAIPSAVAIGGLAVHLSLGLHPWRALYETLALFAIGSDLDVGSELRGGSTSTDQLLFNALWALRVIAPAVTFGVIVDTLSEWLDSRSSFKGRDHVILVGAGRLGRRLAKQLAATSPDAVVVINKVRNQAVDELQGLGVTVLLGDARDAELLSRAGVGRARAMVSVTDSDVTNLAIGLVALLHDDAAPDLTATAQVSDDEVWGGFKQELDPRISQRLGRLDRYSSAASALVSHHADSMRDSRVVVAGVGRFGRAVVRLLAASNAGIAELHAVDNNAAALEMLGTDGVVPHCGDIDNVATWKCFDEARKTTIILCTDNDEANIRLALRQARQLDTEELSIVTRTFDWPAALRGQNALLRCIQVVSIYQLIEEDLRGWVEALRAGERPPERMTVEAAAASEEGRVVTPVPSVGLEEAVDG